MRDYSQFSSSFWTGDTGKALRKHPSAQRLASYLLTSPHSNVIGLYFLPLQYAAYETGMDLADVVSAMELLSSPEINFAHYDHKTEFVWVSNMARIQLTLGDAPLEEKDNRLKAARKAVEAARRTSLHPRFIDAYGFFFGIKKHSPQRPTEPPSNPLRTPLKGESSPPSKGQSTASEEQEQEMEQEMEKEKSAAPAEPLTSTPPVASPDPVAKQAKPRARNEAFDAVVALIADEYRAVFPSNAPPNAEGSIVGKLLKDAEGDPERVRRALRSYLRDPYWLDKGARLKTFAGTFGDIERANYARESGMAAKAPTGAATGKFARPQRAAATTAKDFEDEPSEEEQLALLKAHG